LLCAFSVRGLLQEPRLAGQQVREPLERTGPKPQVSGVSPLLGWIPSARWAASWFFLIVISDRTNGM
jgi:hypothetical protein